MNKRFIEIVRPADITEDIINKNKTKIAEDYSEEYTESILRNVLKPINDVWFRSVCVGFEHFPERNNPEIPLILATNHSGMAFPWDAIIFCYKLLERFKFSSNKMKTLVSPMLTNFRLMNPFLITNLWKKVGGVDATYLNFETMMHSNEHNILIYPEGVAGIGKGFDKRYQLQELKTSFLRMSIKYKTDIVTFSTVNGEYINPFAYASKFANKLAKFIGIPFLPLGITTILVLLQPWFFYIAFPAKLTFVFGRRIKAYEMIDKPYEEITQQDYKLLAEKVRKMMQEDLTAAKRKFGRKPYQMGELFRTILKNMKLFPNFFLACWPLVFTEFDRLYTEGKYNMKLNIGFIKGLKIIIRSPFTISYFIPILGWIPIFIKGKQKVKSL